VLCTLTLRTRTRTLKDSLELGIGKKVKVFSNYDKDLEIGLRLLKRNAGKLFVHSKSNKDSMRCSWLLRTRTILRGAEEVIGGNSVLIS
jgi:hypothetical protein